MNDLKNYVNTYQNTSINEIRKNIFSIENRLDELKNQLVQLESNTDKSIKYDYITFEETTLYTLIDRNDQINILECMKKELPEDLYNSYTNRLRSLFWHVDNIRYVYKQAQLIPPAWFCERYGNLFTHEV